MVGAQAVRITDPFIAINDLSESLKEGYAIGVDKEDLLTSIPTARMELDGLIARRRTSTISRTFLFRLLQLGEQQAGAPMKPGTYWKRNSTPTFPRNDSCLLRHLIGRLLIDLSERSA